MQNHPANTSKQTLANMISIAIGRRLAVFNAMALTLWRDRASFALTFVLPPMIFVIFAAVFSAAAGGDLSIRLSVLAPQDEISQTLVEGLNESQLISELTIASDLKVMQHQVREGRSDAGLEILRPSQTEAPEFKIYYDPVKEGAATIVDAALSGLQPSSDADEDDSEFQVAPATRISLTPGGTPIPMASYYVAGVGMLFLFLSGFQTALSIIEERDNGVLERVAASSLGLRPMIEGKFLFLVCQGTLQLLIILLVAKLSFQIPITAPMILSLSIIAAAISAAGLSIFVVGCCRSRSQAHALGAVLALIMGALGGSMAPRFLMAPNIQAIGALTPNAWGIDAIGESLWRSGDISLAIYPLSLLTLSGGVGLFLAYFITKRTLRAG